MAPLAQIILRGSRAKALQAETDTYVAATYPDFRVLQAKWLLNYGGTGQPAIWYVLQHESKPEFVMAMPVMKPDQVTKRFTALGLQPDRDFFTTDGAFRQLGGSDNPLSRADLNDIIDLYVDQKPTRNALVVGTDDDPEYVNLYIDPDPPTALGGNYAFTTNATVVGFAMPEYRSFDAPPEWGLEITRMPAP